MTNFISVENQFDAIRRKNFFTYAFISSFVWMCFHFTLVFFFLLVLQSPIAVGVFLGIGNFVSFLVDPPTGVIQKYFSAKKIFIASAAMMFIVSAIFLYFVVTSGNVDFSQTDIKGVITGEGSAAGQFFGNIINLVLLLISVIFYGIIKELSDVTSLSYIMNNADPSEYADLLSRNNIFSGLGCLGGLVASGVVLAFNPFMAVSILVGIVSFFIAFILKYFDNSNDSFNIDLTMIRNLKVISLKETTDSLKEYATAQIKKADFATVASGMKYVFLKPMELKKAADWGEIYRTTIVELKSFKKILFEPPWSYRLLFLGAVLMFFGFWDTFATSFLIDFLGDVLKQNSDKFLVRMMTSYTFIALLAIPAYGMQIPLIGLSKKIGTYLVTIAGVFLSALSLLFFGISGSFVVILVLGLLNSLGYAAAMPLSQADFSDEYNQVYAEKNKLTEIDSNASSAPLKMLLNLANVVGLVLGGAVVALAGYTGTFVLFGLILLSIGVVGVVKKTEWKL